MPRHKLSDKGIRGLEKPASGQVDYWDEIMRGFGIPVGHGGTKSFFVGTRINGRYRRITLKPSFPNLELAAARTRARQIIADAQAGIGPETRKKREEKGTFGAVAAAMVTGVPPKLWRRIPSRSSPSTRSSSTRAVGPI
jgi:hypothetical protein